MHSCCEGVCLVHVDRLYMHASGMLSSTGVIGVCDCFSCWVVCITIAAAAVAAAAVLLTSQVPFTITPGSEQIRATIARDGLMDVFTKVR